MIIGIGIIISTGYVIFLSNQKKKQKVLKTLVNPNEKVPLPLMEKEIISHDTRKFRFKLPSEKHVLGIYIYIYVYLNLRNNKLERNVKNMKFYENNNITNMMSLYGHGNILFFENF